MDAKECSYIIIMFWKMDTYDDDELLLVFCISIFLK